MSYGCQGATGQHYTSHVAVIGPGVQLQIEKVGDEHVADIRHDHYPDKSIYKKNMAKLLH